MTFETLTLVLFGLLLGAAAVSDLWRRRIPNEVCIAIIALGVATNSLIAGFNGLVSSLVGMLVGFAVLVPFYAMRRMGAGDVKLLAACGAFLGAGGIVNGTCLALFAGGVFGVMVLMLQRMTMYFPRLYCVLPQTQVSNGLKIELPYGVGIAIGALLSTGVTVIRLPVLG